MPPNDLADLLADLQTSLTADLLKRIKTGSATAADLGVAVRLLKDNGITCARTPGNPLDQLTGLVPFPTEGDAEVF